MTYESIPLTRDITINQIYTVHYFEYRSDFYYPGEQHDFWEFQCVDKGSAQVQAGSEIHILNRGQVIFHRPNEFHNLSAIGNHAPNIVVVSFSCDSPCMRFFEKRILTLSDTERNLIGQIIAEARRCIDSPLSDPYTQKMKVRKDSPFGSQQLLFLYLEQLLIHMLRRYTDPPQYRIRNIGDLKTTSPACNRIIRYLEEHIRECITLESICHDNLISKSQLQKLFRTEYGCGAMEFFSHMKFSFAKQLIRENDMNFTLISEFLGYSSIHYFSRQFKKKCGMTPSEYASSIKAISEHPQDASDKEKEFEKGADD